MSLKMELQENAIPWLPTEVLIKIFSYLNSTDLVFCISKVCPQWKEVVNMKTIWRGRRFDPCALENKEMAKLFLKSAPRLQAFVPSECTDHEMGLTAIDNCKELETFYCIDYSADSLLTEKFLQRCPIDCKLLTHVKLQYHSLCELNLMTLGELQCLRILELYCCKAKLKCGIYDLLVHGKLKDLEQLHLYTYFPGNDELVMQITTNCWKLKSLILTNSREISAAGLRKISYCNQLESLGLSNCSNLTDDAVFRIVKCKSLVTLNLSECLRITNNGLSMILENCNKLQCLNIAQLNVTGSVARQIPQALINLRMLNIMGCSNIDQDTELYLQTCIKQVVT